MSELAGKIKAKAIEIGFDKVGFAKADALIEEGHRLKEWLDNGFHGEMKWMEREPEKRADPQLLFAGAKSVVVLAQNYYTPHRHEISVEKGKVSRYAWGDDYHEVMGEKLRQLLAWIQEEIPGADGKACLDIQPAMDKAWAAKAGIGWLGKHSNIITKELGSWVFIGEIFLSIDLNFENLAEPDHCGNCTACIDACPTEAIVLPYVVDSKRCISYANIELRSPRLPEEIAENLNGWLYGCDICQEVCPWNRFEKPSAESRFEPREGNISPGLEGIVELSQEEFSKKFRKSAMKRAKLSGLKRNAMALLKKRWKPEKKDEEF